MGVIQALDVEPFNIHKHEQQRTYMWAIAAARSRRIESVEIMVVICPALCTSLALPESRRDLRNIRLIVCQCIKNGVLRRCEVSHTELRMPIPTTIATERVCEVTNMRCTGRHTVHGVVGELFRDIGTSWAIRSRRGWAQRTRLDTSIPRAKR
jgi:hypothetical protein